MSLFGGAERRELVEAQKRIASLLEEVDKLEQRNDVLLADLEYERVRNVNKLTTLAIEKKKVEKELARAQDDFAAVRAREREERATELREALAYFQQSQVDFWATKNRRRVLYFRANVGRFGNELIHSEPGRFFTVEMKSQVSGELVAIVGLPLGSYSRITVGNNHVGDAPSTIFAAPQPLHRIEPGWLVQATVYCTRRLEFLPSLVVAPDDEEVSR